MGIPSPPPSEIPLRFREQAARWVVELHGPDRNARLEREVRKWIQADPRQAAAFELATTAWEESGNLPAPWHPGTRSLPRTRDVSHAAAAAVTVLLAALAAGIYWARDPVLVTGPGEQQSKLLADGTQVTLNANSRVVVRYDRQVRRVALTRGEAMFEVVKDASRPFEVVAGDRKVIALGTSFLVRREDGPGTALAVTLVEGRVAVEAATGPDALPAVSTADLTLLSSGERLKIRPHAPPALDKPAIETITAWRRGRLVFDDTSLADAVAEFNRYGPTIIRLDDPAIGKFRVGGVFRIGDASSFAHSMADAHHLRVIERGHQIVITGPETN